MKGREGWSLVALAVAAAAALEMSATITVVKGGISVPLNGLMIHYYKNKTTCKRAEEFVQAEITKMWAANHSITPALLRLTYSDCLITGCDGSILLDGKDTEKTAPTNDGLRGFDVIDRIKKVLEKWCPGIVSCADILQLATKEAAALAGAPRWPVLTGRRDGFQSKAEWVDLPLPNFTWNQTLAYFQAKGLDVLDLGTLLGAHSTGVTHCRHFLDRLYNFQGTGKPDPSMDPSLVVELQKQCPPSGADPTVFLNPSMKNYSFSSTFYQGILKNRSVLEIDQQLLTSKDGFRIAYEFANGFKDLREAFALAMARMGSLGVLTGKNGEIRRNCRYTNAHNRSLK